MGMGTIADDLPYADSDQYKTRPNRAYPYMSSSFAGLW